MRRRRRALGLPEFVDHHGRPPVQIPDEPPVLYDVFLRSSDALDKKQDWKGISVSQVPT